MIEFKLPDIGEGVAEGEIVKWLVSEGDSVDEHQSIVEVMTDKATVEVPAPAAGRITKLLAAEGDTIPVGNVIFHLDDGKGGGAAKAEPKSQEPKKQAEPAKPQASQSAPKNDAPAKPAAQPAPAAAKSGGGSRIDFKLPDVGEGVAEGEIVKWLVEEGAQVEEHQSVVEVMTDKATVEVPAPAAGRVVEFRAMEGETVPVGNVIFVLETGTGAAAAEPEAPARKEAAATKAAAGVASAPSTASSNGPARAASGAPARTSAADGKVLAVPSARRVARELGVDLTKVSASGRGGVVRRADVEAYAADGGAKAAPARPGAPADKSAKPAAAPARPTFAPIAVPAGEREKRTPFRGVRKKIAEAMSRSMFTAVHFTVVEEVDVTELVALRNTAKAIGERQGIKVTYMPFIMKATALALARFPMLNGRLDEEAGELVHYNYVNLGIATDTPNGLIVPVIPDVQAKGILQLAAELGEMAERTRSGKVKPEELRGSTFTITNAGNIGGILATPVINFPDIGILGVHRIRKMPAVVTDEDGEDTFEVRQFMNFSASVDHRLADGADAARFLVAIKELLETPGLLAL